MREGTDKAPTPTKQRRRAKHALAIQWASESSDGQTLRYWKNAMLASTCLARHSRSTRRIEAKDETVHDALATLLKTALTESVILEKL